VRQRLQTTGRPCGLLTVPRRFINLALLAVIAVVCAIVESILERKDSPRGAYWFYGDNRPDDNPNINGLITFGFVYSSVGPLKHPNSVAATPSSRSRTLSRSRYTSPSKLYEQFRRPGSTSTSKCGTRRRIPQPYLAAGTCPTTWVRSNTFSQTRRVLSLRFAHIVFDSHRQCLITLIQNVMIFRQCSVGGRAYKGDDHEKPDGVNHSADPSGMPHSVHSRSRSHLETMEEEHTDDDGAGQSSGTSTHFKDSALAADLEDAADSTSEHARQLNGFFSCIALCHSALTSVDPTTKKITYKAQSPDEAALVQAAADVGFVFLGRDREVLRIQTPFEPGETQEWELLNMLDFTSARKRMSVIVRRIDDDDKIVLFTKGADNVIFERLAPGKQDLRNITEGHLEDFANDGLRTLCLAYKIIPSV